MLNTLLTVGGFFIALVALITGSIVFFKNKKNRLHQTFAIFCFFMALWSSGYFFPSTQHSESLTLFSMRYLMVGAIFIAVAHFHFVSVFLKINKEKWISRLIFWGYVFNIFILFTLPTKWFIDGVSPAGQWNFWGDAGHIYTIWLIIWLGYIVYSVILLLKAFKNNIGIRRQQIKYVLIGDFLTFGFGSTNFFLWYDIPITPYFNFIACGQILTFAYVIVRYRTIEIHSNYFIFLKRFISILLALGSTIGLYIIYTNNLININFQNDISTQIIFGLVLLFIFIFLDSFFNSQIFYKILRLDHTDRFKNIIRSFFEKKDFYINNVQLINDINKTFIEKLKIDSAELILSIEKIDNEYPHLKLFFEAHPKGHLIREEIALQQERKEKEFNWYNELKLIGEACFPIWNRNEKLIGFFVLGYKPFQNPYSQEEIELIKSAVVHIGLSLAILQYNKDLQEEVDKKTKQLQESYQRLKELDASKDAFLSIASHELRTPMTVIKGYTEFLLSGAFGEVTEKQKEFLDKIFRNTDGLIDLVNKMLDISKLEAGKMPFKFEEFNLTEMMEKFAEEYQLICQEKDLKLTFENPENLDMVIRNDKEKMQIIFNNLLGNAFKFTPEHGQVKLILQHCDINKDCLRVTVWNSGAGIPKDKQDAVFEKFQQADNHLNKTYKGTGLGLSIVREIITRVGGKVWIESEPNQGTNFVFFIPITAVE